MVVIKMSRQYHEIKCETQYFREHEKGLKHFELRFNDRNYWRGDMVELIEVENHVKTGRRLLPKEIVSILYGPIYGLAEGWCILGFKE